MKFIPQDIPGIWVIELQRFSDQRGYFMETFRQDVFDANVGKTVFVQDNESYSTRGVVRGLHFQAGQYSQAKLVRVCQGHILDVAIDLRSDSPTYGRHVAIHLDGESGRQLFIPRGFAHGFAVLSDNVLFQYKVDNYYAPQAERTLLFDDPALGIDWLIDKSDMIISDKDRRGVPLKDIDSGF